MNQLLTWVMLMPVAWCTSHINQLCDRDAFLGFDTYVREDRLLFFARVRVGDVLARLVSDSAFVRSCDLGRT